MQGNTGKDGFIDLLIESNNYCTVLEMKALQLKDVVLKGKLEDKAKQLVDMSLTQILKLGLKRGSLRTTVEEWLGRDKIREQLFSYVTSPTVEEAKEKVRAYMVVIIGSRHILIREMDRAGEWISDWKLVGRVLDKEGFEEVEAEASDEESPGVSEEPRAPAKAPAKKPRAPAKKPRAPAKAP